MKRAATFAILTLAALAMGCTPELGDKCVLSTDCSLRGDRTCDTSQPGGYCTIRDCRPNGCPDEGACVLFEPSVPGCGFDNRSRGRVARSYCMASCEEDADCRDGYVCTDPKASPWFGVILDDDTGKRVCILPPSGGASSTPAGNELPVCSAIAADAGAIDAHSVYDATLPSDAALDAPDAGPSDAGADGDATPGPTDASDAG